MDTKILLVDDEERILQTFARTLRLGGYSVITAEDGEEGLALYRQEQPDVILLDLRMPGMSGLEVLQAIREDDPEANVILCTAHGDKDAVIEALRAGASDFLPKPIDQVTLESALRRAEERIHLKRELRASQEALRQQNVQLEETVEARTEELRETVAQLRERVKEMTCLYAVSHDMQEDVSVDELCQRIIGHLIPAMEFPEITVPLIELNGQRFHPPDRTENRSHSLSAEIKVEGETVGQLWVTYTEERPFLIPEEQDLVNGVAEALSTWLERRRAEDALQASERRFHTLFDAMIEGVALHQVIYDPAGTAIDYVLLDANPAYEGHTGIPVEEAKGQRASELYSVEEPPYLDRYARVTETGKPVTFDTHFVPLDRHFSISVFSPAESQFATVFEDVTERKEMEEALRESLIKYRVLFDAFPLGITIADREGKILEANPISERLLGISLEEHTARDIDGQEWHIIRPDGSPMPAEEYASVRALQENQLVRSVEMGIVKPNADVTWLDVTAAPLMDDRVVVTYNDVTDRRRAEEDLQLASAKLIEDLHWLSQTALHLLSLTDASEILDYAARALQEKLGDCFVWPLTRTSDGQALRLGSLPGMDDSLLGKAIELIGFDPRGRAFDIVPEFREIYQQGLLFRHGGGLAGFAASQVPRSVGEALAKLLGVHDVYTIGLVGREQVLGNLHIAARRPELIEAPELVASFAHQVALALEQATANEALEESEERYRAVSELVSDYAYAFRVEPDGRLIGEWVTEAFYRITGYTPEELPVGESWNRLFHPEDRLAIERHIGKLLEGQPHDLAYRIITRDGDERWVHTYNRPEWDEREHRVTRIYGAVQDVADRKRAEEALQESYEQLSLLFDILPVGVSVLDQERRVVEQNRALRRIVALSEDELLEGEYRNRHYLRADGSPMPAEEFPSSRILSGESEVQCAEVGVVKEDGELIWTDVRAVGCSIGDWRVVIVTTDITERKQAEEALQESEEKYRRLVEGSPDVVYIYSDKRGALYWSQRVEEVLGFAPADLIKDPYLWHDAIHPDDVAAVDRAIAESKRGAGFDIEYRVQDVDGDWHWFHDRFISKRRIEDELIIEGLATDITERKRAEEARRESEERFRMTVHLSPIGVGIVDHTGQLVDCNIALAEMVGYSREELLSFNFADFTHPDDLEREWELINKLWEGERTEYRIEKRYIHRDGRPSGSMWQPHSSRTTREN